MLSLYNLAMVTADAREKADLLEQLMASKTHYRNAWYVKRERGAMYWWDANAIEERDGPEAARPTYARAADMYTQAIRLRPRLKIHLTRRSFDLWYHRTPPLLMVNAGDAHYHAGNAIRGFWYRWRGYKRRTRWLKVAHKAFKRHRWARAALYFEHVAVVRADRERTLARTWEAIALRQMGHTERAEEMWRETLAEDPTALSWRALAVLDASYGLSALDLPGNEPTDVESVNARIAELESAARL
jgi:tetratricopeptide (TPR) repeat protein